LENKPESGHGKKRKITGTLDRVREKFHNSPLGRNWLFKKCLQRYYHEVDRDYRGLVSEIIQNRPICQSQLTRLFADKDTMLKCNVKVVEYVGLFIFLKKI